MSVNDHAAFNDDDSNLDAVITHVKQEFKTFLAKRSELVIKLGEAFERKVSDIESICEEIKNTLAEEIAQRLISIRDIERYCPDKWKRKTRPKKEERIDKLSIPEDKQYIPELLVSADGIKINEPADITNSNSNNNDDVINLERSKVENKCIDEHPADVQLEDAARNYPSFASPAQQLFERDEIKKLETKNQRLELDLQSKSNENFLLQSQVEDLKSKLEARPHNHRDESFEVQFQVPFEHLRDHMRAAFSKNNAVSEVLFAAKVDVPNRKLTDIEIG